MSINRLFKVRNRDWCKFIDEQKYWECQVVTAINARYWLTGKTIGRDSQRYEKLVDLAGARHGGAVSISKVHEKLGLQISKTYEHLYNINCNMLPLEINVWHKGYGSHSVLVIDCERKSGAVRVANFSMATSMYGWIFWEDLQHYVKLGTCDWQGRRIKLIG